MGFIACSSGSGENGDSLVEEVSLQCTPKELSFNAKENLTSNISVTCNREWTAYSNDSWIECKVNGYSVSVTVAENEKYEERTGSVIIKAGTTREAIEVKQAAKPEMETGDIVVPEGYRLVWHDEFDDKSKNMPDTDNWYYEIAEPGWVNNELQTYIAGKKGDIQTAEISHGTLKIHAIKDGNRIYSARLNTRGEGGKSGKGWKYGYMRLV